jgi:uncharacterized Zn finger protein (UPF0148 family)
MDSSRTSDVDNESKSEIKDAASYLLKGGSLLSAPCADCNGVQIQYRGAIICINCGKQQTADEATAKPGSDHKVTNAVEQFHDHTSFLSHIFGEEIRDRMAEHFKILRSGPVDLNNEKQRIEIIGMYLDLLERLRNYSNKIHK